MDTSHENCAVLSVELPRLFAAVDEGADDVHGQRLTRTQVVTPQLSEHVLARLFYHLLHAKPMLISCEVYQASQMGSYRWDHTLKRNLLGDRGRHKCCFCQPELAFTMLAAFPVRV